MSEILELVIPDTEFLNNRTQEFSYVKGGTLQMKHSLVSLSKWESKWMVPYLSAKDLTEEQTLDYFKCMTLNQHVDPMIYLGIGPALRNDIYEYINAPMSATRINRKNKKTSTKIITSEVIYSWMIELGIPFECQKWHLNRLLMLIDVCAANKETPQKMSQAEIARQNREINEMRKRKLNTSG